ncbi:MAG: hypothetical protein R8G66_12195 [Cytophagales bacterium]|nr:hypothetical protein [Cytophagales bacterium]
MRTIKLVPLLIFLTWTPFLKLKAQSDAYFPDGVASSPTAAGIISALEFPTDLSSGKPSISIPLYTIERDGVTVPISLSYNAQGIKVNQVAGYAGLNWNLNAGGSVTRLVNGLHDEFSFGYMSGKHDISGIMDTCSSASPNKDAAYCDYRMLQADYGEIDLKPDEFFFQFGAYSGKFFYNQEQEKFVFQSKEDLAVEYYRAGGNTYGKIVGFRFTTPYGVKYYFGVESENDNSPILEKKSTSGILHSFNSSNIDLSQNPYHSLWPLRRIVTTNGQEINFYYRTSIQEYNTKGGEWISEYENDNYTNNVRVERHLIEQPELEEIDFGLGSVFFSSWGGSRLDYRQGTALGSVSVLDQNNNQIKKFNFNYDHYTTSESLPPFVLSTYQEGVKNRLRLISIQEEGDDGSLIPPYVFGYNGNFLPSLYNSGQDYWGYYNGEDNGHYVKQNIGTQESRKKRQVNPQTSSVGILNKITYPTGGYTLFSFESNKGGSTNIIPGPDYFGTELHSEFIEKLDGRSNSENEFWDEGLNRYVLDFEVEITAVQGEAKLYMDLPGPCPMTGQESTSCPYLVRLDGNVYPNANISNISDLSAGMHRLEIIPQNNATIDPNDYFFEVLIEYYAPDRSAGGKLVSGEIFMGGLRVKSTSSYSSDNELLFKKDYYYRNGIAVSLPSFIESIYVAGLQMPCTSASQFGNHELVGSGYEYPHYVEVYEDMFRTQANELPDGSTVPPYSKIVSYFDEHDVEPLNNFTSHPYPSPDDLQFQMNKLTSKEYYDEDGKVKTETYGYLDNVNEYHQQDHILGIAGFRNAACRSLGYNPSLNTLDPATYKLYTGLDRVRSVKEVTYYDKSSSSTTLTKSYFDSNEHSQLTSTTVSIGTDTSSESDLVISEYLYADDLINGTEDYLIAYGKLTQLGKAGNLYRPAIPLITKSYRSRDAGLNKKLISNSQLVLDDFNQNVAVSEQWSAVGDADLEKNFTILKRNDQGKPTEVVGRNGVTSCFIWGYGGELLIGKVIGTDYNSIKLDVEGLVSLSNLDIDQTSEDNLRNGILTFIQTHPNSQGSFVTFDPLLGVTSTIDRSGLISYYEYDEFGRLKKVIDHDANVLQHYEYNYKN